MKMTAASKLLGMTAEWWSAFGSIFGAAGTIAAVWLALKLANRQSEESAKRDARKQAEKVTAWVDRSTPAPQGDPHKVYQTLRVRNASNQVVYDLIAQSVIAGAASGQVERTGDDALAFGALVGNVPPGETVSRINYGGGGMHKRFSVEITFKDAAGLYWVRYGDGSLQQAYSHPLDRYRIDRPASWEN
jgi:hypothetical protein